MPVKRRSAICSLAPDEQRLAQAPQCQDERSEPEPSTERQESWKEAAARNKPPPFLALSLQPRWDLEGDGLEKLERKLLEMFPGQRNQELLLKRIPKHVRHKEPVTGLVSFDYREDIFEMMLMFARYKHGFHVFCELEEGTKKLKRKQTESFTVAVRELREAPDGSPLLEVMWQDHQTMKQLFDSGRLNKEKAEEFYGLMWGEATPAEMPNYNEMLCTRKQLDFTRWILERNMYSMTQPTRWQAARMVAPDWKPSFVQLFCPVAPGNEEFIDKYESVHGKRIKMVDYGIQADLTEEEALAEWEEDEDTREEQEILGER